ncbi:hypothetical protein BDV27DRAFT_88429 [Aspergillus caelatus]|uniref:Uncharacterized protein n=1 Tax=Aspergillus caelatus TaxID=61420 RepID=A0A5N6ZIA7_9EURO|nr:uncharacterized protein BDV27DRAFT_88429 [Aspergillus caelatus]KAE8357351.1 hypothetical protein BDV27DRAFT_88429 [Aspergillus caelatus]
MATIKTQANSDAPNSKTHPRRDAGSMVLISYPMMNELGRARYRRGGGVSLDLVQPQLQ